MAIVLILVTVVHRRSWPSSSPSSRWPIRPSSAQGGGRPPLLRPWSWPGRNIYVREGCYVCHSQMIRPFRDEVERYGHYSLAAESMYDHPFQWGSKRTGPDLARVGGRYSNDWHVAHFLDPRAVVPESVMPGYGYLAEWELGYDDIAAHLETNRKVGVPYTDEMIAAAADDLAAQADPDGDHDELLERYPKAVVGDFDGDPDFLSEMDAMIAYLQMLGTLVDFTSYRPEYLDAAAEPEPNE